MKELFDVFPYLENDKVIIRKMEFKITIGYRLNEDY